MNNEKGSALLVALIACLIMSALGTILIVTSMDGTKFANTTNVNMQAIRNGQTELNQIIQEFKVLMDAGDTLKTIVSGKKYTEYNDRLTNIETELEKKHTPDPDKKEKNGLTLEDITGETIENGGLGLKKPESFSRVFRFTLTKTVSDEGGEISKKFTTDLMLSPTPSFLQFATGSQEKVILRGGLEIIGDVYGNTAIISRLPHYFSTGRDTVGNPMDLTELLAESTFPKIMGSLYLNKDLGVIGGATTTESKKHEVIDSPPKKAAAIDANGFSTLGGQYLLNIYTVNQYKHFFNSYMRNNTLLPGYDQTILMKNKHSYIDVDYPKMMGNTFAEGTSVSVAEDDPLSEFVPTPHTIGGNITTGTPVIDKLLENTFPTQPEVVVYSNPATGNTLYDYDAKNATAKLAAYQATKGKIFIIEADVNTGDIYTPANFAGHDVILMTDFINWPITSVENPATATDTMSASATASRPVLPINLDLNRSNINRTFTIDENLDIRDKLLIVDGNLEIVSNGKLVNIEATTGKIIVNGRLTIRGEDNAGAAEQDNVQINTTIYANGFDYYKEKENTGVVTVEPIDSEVDLLMGKNAVDIHDTKISKGSRSMILLSNGDILLRKINEFSRVSSLDPKDSLEMFLYSNKKIEVFGIASAFNIKGGIFAKEGLALNAVRQDNVTLNNLMQYRARISGEYYRTGTFDSFANQKASTITRLKITHDPSILLEDENSLPLADGIQYIMRNTSTN